MELSERRVNCRKGLHELYLPIYDAICKELSPYWAPYYGLRTIEEQNALYGIGRTLNIEGKTVTNAPGGFSPHNYGCASDWVLWTVGNQPIWLPAEDARWNEYKKAVEKARGKWGGAFQSVDCPHNELPLSVSWYSVGSVFQSNGMDAAKDFLSGNTINEL